MTGPAACRAFGAEAKRWSSRLPVVPAVIADASDAAHALESAVQARIAGEPQYVAVQVDDVRSTIASALGAAVFEQYGDLDVRHAACDQIAAGTLPLNDGRDQGSLTTFSQPVLTTLRHVYDIADHLLVRSWAERDQLFRLFGHGRPLVRRFAPLDPDVPAPEASSGRRDAIVVWAPRRTARETALLALAFDEMDLPVYVVCKGGPAPAMRNARFISPADAGFVLARALVLVDAEISDPGTARALAVHGVPIAVTSTSGAAEYLEPAFIYDPWSWRSVFRAVMAALGDGRAPAQIAEIGELADPQLPMPEFGSDAPLVSIVTPTYNRRERIARCLRRWSQHRYPNLEHVVVNDGGTPIADLVAEYPRARLIDLPENLGPPGALNAGVAEARGTFMVLAADDDEYSPDHVSRLAAALIRTGKTVAHSNTVIRHEQAGADGEYTTTGYSLLWNTPLERTGVLTGGILALQSAMMRREAFADAGWYDPSLPHARDYAMIAELAKRHDFVHVDTTTLIYALRTDASSERFKERGHETTALRMIYERNPAPNRPAIAGMRARILDHSVRTGSNMFSSPALPL